MQDLHQLAAATRESHSEENIFSHVPSNHDEAASMVSAMAAAASRRNFPLENSHAISSDIPPLIVHEGNEDAPDLDIDDMPVVANELPAASDHHFPPKESENLPQEIVPPKDVNSLPQDVINFDSVTAPHMEKLKTQVSSKHKRMPRVSSKNDAFFNKKIEKHIKESGIHAFGDGFVVRRVFQEEHQPRQRPQLEDDVLLNDVIPDASIDGRSALALDAMIPRRFTKR